MVSTYSMDWACLEENYNDQKYLNITWKAFVWDIWLLIVITMLLFIWKDCQSTNPVTDEPTEASIMGERLVAEGYVEMICDEEKEPTIEFLSDSDVMFNCTRL